MAYSSELKAAIVQKALSTDKSHKAVAEENGVGISSLRRWLKEYREPGALNVRKQEKRPQDWTAEERISALIETGNMSAEERGTWLRKHGLHTHHLEKWKTEAIKGVSTESSKAANREEHRLRQENKNLKKELHRKEKALAEAAALLVLKKKAESIWGEPEDD
ncbi:transposase [Desulfoluna spongiiphila]|uniref:transposase n=1 Tax=Desulfoluna spongiiphila TaxID=419481 RepID=UPI00125A8D9C|nr:transposase [Desulfoluna spongiiphila]VVS95535.1 consensus disorder prediction [Desulfoluna spongiiphila]